MLFLNAFGNYSKNVLNFRWNCLEGTLYNLVVSEKDNMKTALCKMVLGCTVLLTMKILLQKTVITQITTAHFMLKDVPHYN